LALPTNDGLSTTPAPGAFRSPLPQTKARLIDWSRGGLGIQDASAGLDVRDWRARAIGRDVFIGAPGHVADVLFFTLPVDPWDIAFSFDTNMNVVLGWEGEDYSAAFRWFDPVESEYVIVDLPAGTRDVRVQFDDVRRSEYGQFGDTIITYIRGTSLYYLRLRDRFEVERELYTHPRLELYELRQAGMNDRTPPRFQWRLEGGISRPRA